MKKLCYIALIALTNVWAGRAQTNAASNTSTNVNVNTNAVNQILALVTTNAPAAKPKLSETVIEADGPADFAQVGHGVRVIYRDHVRVIAPGLKLWCEWLAADLSEASGHPTNIVAETNVVIDATDDKGQKMHATGDKAVYVFSVQNGTTNETVTLTGDATAEYKNATLTGDQIIWDRLHDSVRVPVNPKMVFHQGINLSLTDTNAPTVETNSPVAKTNSPVATTNSPVATTNSPPAATNQTTVLK